MTDTCDSCARPWPAIDTLSCAPSTSTSRRARRSRSRRAATSCGLNFRKPSTRWNCTGWRCRMASASHLDTCFPLTGATGTTSGSTSGIPTTRESKEHFTPSARLRRHWPECSAFASRCLIAERQITHFGADRPTSTWRWLRHSAAFHGRQPSDSRSRPHCGRWRADAAPPPPAAHRGATATADGIHGRHVRAACALCAHTLTEVRIGHPGVPV